MIKESILPEYDHEMGSTRRLLERLPEEKLSWKPHQKSMSMAGLATHLANIPSWAGAILDDSCFDLAAAPPPMAEERSRADILARFDQNVVLARSAIAARSDSELMAGWTLKRGEYEMFTLPKVACLRTFLLNHIIHHRGQLSVYLRLNDVPVPAIYGPSADEGM
jgi:uncharacterized damage-inducible protein DinB